MSLAVTWGSTHAAFFASTDNAGNSWQTGSVVLHDNDSGAALFATGSHSGLKPGSTKSRCIRIDYTGDLPADIRMYATTPPTGAASLDPYLLMSVERGADVDWDTPVAADCTAGFTPTSTPTFLYNTAPANGSADQTRTLAHLKANHRNFDTGLLVSAGTSQHTHLTLRITYSVMDNNDAQNTQSSATFTWEARNTP